MPVVLTKCCFCIPLKIACYIIGVLHLVPLLITSGLWTIKEPDKCYKTEFLSIAHYVGGIVTALVVVVAILFLVGLWTDTLWMIIVFLATLLLLIAYTIASIVVLLLYQKVSIFDPKPSDPTCPHSSTFTMAGMLVIMYELYMAIVVNSYRIQRREE